jgi:hypothetical protein
MKDLVLAHHFKGFNTWLFGLVHFSRIMAVGAYGGGVSSPHGDRKQKSKWGPGITFKGTPHLTKFLQPPKIAPLSGN